MTSHRQGNSLTIFLMVRILLCLLPLFILSSWLAFDSVHSLREQQNREANQLAKNLMGDVDMFLDARILGLQMLAKSSLVDDPELWPHLHQQAHAYFSSFGSHVILLEVDDAVRVRLHSRLPFDSAMPQPPPASAQTAQRAVTSASPIVSHVFVGALTGEDRVIIAVPALTPGPSSLVFVTTIPTRYFARHLDNYALPEGWTIHLHDRHGHTITCNSAETWSLAEDSPRPGQFQLTSALSGWSVFLGISPQAWHKPLLAAALTLFVGILVTTLLGLVIGRHTSRRLNNQVKALSRIEKPAENLAIREFHKARQLLDDTHFAMRQHMEETEKARDKAEQALAELERQHSALEQLHYTISHDLRTPLVTMETFMGFLEQDLASDDASLVGNDVEHIRTAIRRMNHLLNDLGRLLQTKNNEPAALIKFDQLAHELAQVLAGPLAVRGAELTIIPADLTLYAGYNHLIQIWQNLIENAIKYMGEQPQPVIEIGVDQQPQGPIFYVRDNGIGIEESDQQRIFGLFDQLDPNNPGSGLGLTLIKRIVEMYGGRIWVESQGEGHGSCFYFTLPAAVITDKAETY